MSTYSVLAVRRSCKQVAMLVKRFEILEFAGCSLFVYLFIFLLQIQNPIW
jgi:hypothetical protein